MPRTRSGGTVRDDRPAVSIWVSCLVRPSPFRLPAERFSRPRSESGTALLKQPVVELPALVEQFHVAVEGLAQGIALSAQANLVFAVLELAGQVLRKGACVMQRENEPQFRRIVQDRTVGIGIMLGLDREAGVVVDHEARQKGVGGTDITDLPEPEFLHQPVLKCFVGAFDASFRLRGVSHDIERSQGPGELTELILALTVVDPEDAVLVGIHRHRTPVLIQIRPQRRHVGLGGLGRGKAQSLQAAGGIVDEDDQGAPVGTTLEPVVGEPPT